MKLLFASSNAGKYAEMSRLFADSREVSILSSAALIAQRGLMTPVPQPEENGITYEENAAIKAEQFYLWAGVASLSDDTGLEVSGLNGAPGLRSARYAGERASAEENIRKLLSELSARGYGSPDSPGRDARFVCVVCVWGLGESPIFAQGELKGRIAAAPHGTGGFGYDSVFTVDGYNETLASLKARGVHVATHRQKAIASLLAHCLKAS